MDIQTGPYTSSLMTVTSLTTTLFSLSRLVSFALSLCSFVSDCLPAYRCIYVYHTYAYTSPSHLSFPRSCLGAHDIVVHLISTYY